MPNRTHRESDAARVAGTDASRLERLRKLDDDLLAQMLYDLAQCRELLESLAPPDDPRRGVLEDIFGSLVKRFVAAAHPTRISDPRMVRLGTAFLAQIDHAEFPDQVWADYTPETLASRMLHSVPNVESSGKNMWDEAIGPFFDTTGLRRWKGVTRQRLDTLRKSNRLIALTSADNKLLYPEFQFGRAGELLPHLDEVLPALRRSYNDWDAALWLNTPSDHWTGKTAAQVLREGNGEAYRRILAEARADAASLAS